MSTVITSAQYTIVDLYDPVQQGTAPENPVADMLWIDTSVTPNLLKRWDGIEWVTVNDVDTSILEERITTCETKIDEQDDQISLMATKEEVTTIDGEVKGILNQVARIDEKSDSISLTVAQKSSNFWQETAPTTYNAGDVWVRPSTGEQFLAVGATGKNTPIFASNEQGSLLYDFEDGADGGIDIRVDEDGNLILLTEGNYSIVNDELSGKSGWVDIVSEQYAQLIIDTSGISGVVTSLTGNISAVSQQANKIEWIVGDSESMAGMQLTSKMLELIADKVNIMANTINLSANHTMTFNADQLQQIANDINLAANNTISFNSNWLSAISAGIDLSANSVIQDIKINKNRTFALALADAPTTDLAVGDLLIDTSNANRLYRWNGSTWVQNSLKVNVGGRNLIKTSDPIRSVTRCVKTGDGKGIILTGNSTRSQEFILTLVNNTEVENEYTLSFNVSGLGSDEQLALDIWGGYKLISSSQTPVIRKIGSTSITNGKARFTFISKELFQFIRVLISSTQNAQSATLTNFKLEEGNVATSYTDAPEDIDARVTQAEISIRPDNITSTVITNNAYIEDVDDRVGDKLDGVLSNYTRIDQLDDSVIATVGSLGYPTSRNLLLDSKKEVSYLVDKYNSNNYYTAFELSDYGKEALHNLRDFKVTVSYDAKASVAQNQFYICIESLARSKEGEVTPAIASIDHTIDTLTTDYKHYSHTITKFISFDEWDEEDDVFDDYRFDPANQVFGLVTVSTANTADELHIPDLSDGSPGLEAGIVYIKNVKIEIGDTATSWSSAPEDTENGIAYAKYQAGEAYSLADSVQSQFERIVRIQEDGLHVGDNQSNGEVLIDSSSVSVVVNSKSVSQFAGNYIRLGNMLIRQPGAGGLTIQVADAT